MDHYQELKERVARLVQQEQWLEALGVLEELTQALPENHVLAYNRALVHWRLGDLESAEHWLQEALHLAPTYAPGLAVQQQLLTALQTWYMNQVTTYFAAENWDNAHRMLTKIVARWPDQANYQYHLALVEHRRGNHAAARQRLQGILARYPNHQQVISILAEVNNALQQQARAEDVGNAAPAFLSTDDPSFADEDVDRADDAPSPQMSSNEAQLARSIADAVAAGQVAHVRELLAEYPIFVQWRDMAHGGKSLLHFAAEAEADAQEEIIPLLLDYGADANAVTDDGMSVLQCPSLTSTSLRLLLKAGAHAHSRNAYLSPLMTATVYLPDTVDRAWWDGLRKVRLLVEMGADCSHDPLLAALCFQAHLLLEEPKAYAAVIELITWLLGKGCDPSLPDAKDGGTPLHRAVEYALPDLARLFLEHHAEVNAQNQLGQTPLHLAAGGLRSGEVTLVIHSRAQGADDVGLTTLLLNHGADPTIADHAGNTPLDVAQRDEVRRLLQPVSAMPVTADSGALFTAVLHGDLDAAEQILALAPDLIDAEDANGDTALHLCASAAQEEGATFLLNHGANPEAAGNEYHRTPLHLAVQHGHSTLVALLVAHGAQIEARDNHGNTPLHVAAFSHRQGSTPEIVRQLLDLGADVNALSTHGKTPLMHAITQNQWHEVVEILIAHGADVNIGETSLDMTALHFAAEENNPEIIRLLVAAGAEIEAAERDAGWTSLTLAARSNAADSLTALLELGANTEARDLLGCTPLHWAVNAGRVEATRLLLHAGADVNALNHAGQTPVHLIFFAEEHRHALLTILLDRAPDLSLTDTEHGRTALHEAAFQGDTDAITALAAAGADVDAPTLGGEMPGARPLHLAAGQGHDAAVTLLVKDLGADLNALSDTGYLPAQLAQENGHDTTTQLLEALFEER